MSIPCFCVAAAVSALGVSASRADLIAYERFDYPIGSSLLGATGGFGFSTPWRVDSPSLIGTTRVISGFNGGAMGIETPSVLSNPYFTRILNTTVNTTQSALFVSFQVRDTVLDEALRVGFAFDSTPSTPETFNNISQAQIRAANRYAIDGVLSFITPTTTGIDTVILELQGGRARLYVNPDPANPVPVLNIARAGTNINCLTMNLIANNNSTRTYLIDNVAVGTTLAAVIPSPSSAVALVLAGALGLRRRR